MTKMNKAQLAEFRKQGEKLSPEVLGSMLFALVGKNKVADLISMGLEAGPSATFGVEKYKVPPEVDFMSDPQMGLYKYMDYPLCTDGGVYLFCRHAEDKKEYGPFLLDQQACARGLALMFIKYPHQYANVLDERGADFYTGDTFLQCALLGECVYG
jgi:hypothetical protein